MKKCYLITVITSYVKKSIRLNNKSKDYIDGVVDTLEEIYGNEIQIEIIEIK